MIVEKITVTAAELNTGAEVFKPIAPVEIDKVSAPVDAKRYYRSVEFRVNNNTSDDLEIAFFDDEEKVYHVATPTDLFQIVDGVSEQYKTTRWKATEIVIKGTSGAGHLTDLTIYVIKE